MTEPDWKNDEAARREAVRRAFEKPMGIFREDGVRLLVLDGDTPEMVIERNMPVSGLDPRDDMSGD